MIRRFFAVLFFFASSNTFAQLENAQLVVWSSQAMVATYTFDYKNYLNQQKSIAKYFTADGWINYTQALNDSKLPDTVQKNYYSVSSVPTLPPVITLLRANQWQAVMPLLVVYKNPQYQQTQTLEVTITFTNVTNGQGVNGFAITSLQSKVITPACKCSTSLPGN